MLDMGRMDLYDDSRRADITRLRQELLNPDIPEAKRKKIENDLYMIREQSRHKSIRQMRERLTTAVQNQDTAAAEKIADEARAIDRDYRH